MTDRLRSLLEKSIEDMTDSELEDMLIKLKSKVPKIIIHKKKRAKKPFSAQEALDDLLSHIGG